SYPYPVASSPAYYSLSLHDALPISIIIQHVDGSKTTYGNVSSTDVHIYQYVRQHERIGTFEHSEGDSPVFFSLEQDQTFVDPIRSEEHTSELQSRFDLVCLLLLEKK